MTILKMKVKRIRLKGKCMVAEQHEDLLVTLLSLEHHRFLKEMTLTGATNSTFPSSGAGLPILNQGRVVCVQKHFIWLRISAIEPNQIMS